MKFVCSRCGKKHDFSLNFDYGLPRELVVKLFKEELSMQREERWMIVEEKYFFIRSYFVMPVHTTNETYYWKTWASIEKKYFDKYIEYLQLADNRYDLIGVGTLFMENPYYNNTYGLDVTIVVTNIDSYPQLYFKDQKTKIAIASKNGVSRKEAIEIIESIFHDPF